MSHVHYKFQSSNEHDTITFDGLSISLADLKTAILGKSKLVQSSDFSMQITNAQTKEGMSRVAFEQINLFLYELACLFFWLLEFQPLSQELFLWL